MGGLTHTTTEDAVKALEVAVRQDGGRPRKGGGGMHICDVICTAGGGQCRRSTPTGILVMCGVAVTERV